MSNLLINENPLMVLPELATKIGLNEAIFIQQLHYWLNSSSGVEKDGVNYIYNSHKQWMQQFPFWSESTIKRIIINLQELKLINTRKFNKSRGDMIKFYTINYNKLNNLESYPHHKVNLTQSNRSNWTTHKVNMTSSTSGQSELISTETTTKTTTETTGVKKSKKSENNKKPISNLKKLDNFKNETAKNYAIDREIIDKIYNHRKEIGKPIPSKATKQIKIILNGMLKAIEQGKFNNIEGALNYYLETTWQGFNANWVDIKTNQTSENFALSCEEAHKRIFQDG